MEAVGWFLAATNSLTNAARVWGTAERLRKATGQPLPIPARELLAANIAAARAALADDAAFDAAWQEGRAMTLEQAVELALKESGKSNG